MVRSSPHPTLSRPSGTSAACTFCRQNVMARPTSSTYRNSRRGLPVPHRASAVSGPAAPASMATFASWNLRIIAGRTWLELRSKLSPGPYRFVGISER